VDESSQLNEPGQRVRKIQQEKEEQKTSEVGCITISMVFGMIELSVVNNADRCSMKERGGVMMVS
jgi:hypothetical protein